ncbi:unnamed protein product [Spirodela intermedia]|uniref:Uncharacterized protein n=1 Tax=Spirodela intermedia TaxID=51605 RepID=A0A7I8IX45_SPIIN|nr:unnamed protein product [Spirodela intermedia]CAA6662391.1 unnamed protein product [Spirodela intermedia]
MASSFSSSFPCVSAGVRRGPSPIEACRWLPGLLATAVVLSSSSGPPESSQLPDDATFADVPQTLSGGGGERKRIQKPKSRQAESCTVKCLGTCIRGGAGSPARAPSTSGGGKNNKLPLVVFKSGFRTRNYCLVECSDICNLIKDGDDGP